MDIVSGSGNSRRVATVPHFLCNSRDENEKIREDVKAALLRPTTFANRSSVLEPLLG